MVLASLFLQGDSDQMGARSSSRLSIAMTSDAAAAVLATRYAMAPSICLDPSAVLVNIGRHANVGDLLPQTVYKHASFVALVYLLSKPSCRNCCSSACQHWSVLSGFLSILHCTAAATTLQCWLAG